MLTGSPLFSDSDFWRSKVTSATSIRSFTFRAVLAFRNARLELFCIREAVDTDPIKEMAAR